MQNIGIDLFQIYLIIFHTKASNFTDDQGMTDTTEKLMETQTSPSQLFVSASSIILGATTLSSFWYEEGTSEVPVELQPDDDNQNESNATSSQSYTGEGKSIHFK